MQLLRSVQCDVRDCCVLTETQLHDNILDSGISSANMLHADDRGKSELGSTSVGMLLWSMNAVHQLVEFITAMCQPFYLLRAYMAILLGTVHIPPRATSARSKALWVLHHATREQHSTPGSSTSSGDIVCSITNSKGGMCVARGHLFCS